MYELMIPAVRLVQQMYYDSMTQQHEEIRSLESAESGAGGSDASGQEEEERDLEDVDGGQNEDGKRKEWRFSRDEEKRCVHMFRYCKFLFFL